MGLFEAAIGAYANERGLQNLSLPAFVRTAAYGSSDAGRLFCVAALLAFRQAEDRCSGELLRRASDFGYEGLFASVAHVVLADHGEGNVRPGGCPRQR